MFSPAKLTLLVLLAACGVGEVPLGGGDASTPDAAPDPNEASFTAIIAPLVTECIACHGVVQPPILTSSGALDAKYKMKPGLNNILVTKGDISVPVGIHQGVPYFTEAEEVTVANWIDGLP